MSDDLQALIRRTQSGDADAMTALGKRLLFGDGVAPSAHEGVSLLQEAMNRSNGEAAALMARLAAWGVMRRRDFALALDLLVKSAEQGWGPAQAELRFLARNEGSDWCALRRQVDLAAWLAAPASLPVLNRPRAHVFEAFAAAAECDWIIARLRGDLERAKVHRRAADATVADTRTNSEAGFMLKSSDVAMCLIRDRIAAALRVAPDFCEVTKLLHYLPGQSFTLHADYFDPAVPALRDKIERRGQRYATFLLYLSDNYEGGETDFPQAGFRFKGSKGDALVFFSVDETGAPDPMSMHAGLPPTRGEKWVLSQWIASRAVNAYMTPGPSPPALGADWLKSFPAPA